MFCTNCGKQISETSNFCTECGAKIVVPKNIQFESISTIPGKVDKTSVVGGNNPSDTFTKGRTENEKDRMDESLIDSFELDVCIIDDKLKRIIERKLLLEIFWQSPFLTKWHHVNLQFTSKKIELHFSGQQISMSYNDVKNIDISDLRCRPPKTVLYLGLTSFMVLGIAIISAYTGSSGVNSFQMALIIIGAAIILYNLIFRWVMTYNISLGDQIEFSIKKDDEILKKIKAAYEKGKHWSK